MITKKITFSLSNYFKSKNEVDSISYKFSCKELECSYVVSIRDGKLFDIDIEEDKNGEDILLNIDTPMFLGLDRRFVNTQNDIKKAASNFLLNFNDDDKYSRDEPLDFVKELIKNTVQKNRTKLFGYNTKLRNNLLMIFLEEIPQDFQVTPEHFKNIFEAHEKFNNIQSSIKNLMLSYKVLELINKRLLDYSLLSSELKNKLHSTKNDKVKQLEVAEEISRLINNDIYDYIRLGKVLDELENFQNKQRDIYKKINLFKGIINNFFESTDKKIHISGNGDLKIKIQENIFNLDILSSGERQIIILIGNLIFNESVSNKKIFIIDEPELSLHVYWQEIFLNSILEGSESIQFIIATHSPSIVSDYQDFILEINNPVIDDIFVG